MKEREFPMKRRTLVVVVSMALIVAFTTGAWAQETAPKPKPRGDTISVWDTIKSGGTVGWLIILLSIATVTVAADRARTIRPSALIPPQVTQQIQELLKSKHMDELAGLCNRENSIVAKVIASGLSQIKTGYRDMESAMQEEGAKQAAELHRRVELLSLIGNVAPMLGLLGTVIGMIQSFNTIAQSQGFAKPAELADGISKALVTTCMGLIVAIPAMCAYVYFQNRVDKLCTQAAEICEQLMRPFKQLKG